MNPYMRPFSLSQRDVQFLRWVIGRARANTSNLGFDGEAEQHRRCNVASDVVDRLLNLRVPAEQSEAADWIDCPEEPPAAGWWWFRERSGVHATAADLWGHESVSGVRLTGVAGTWGWDRWRADHPGWQIWPIPITTPGEPEQPTAEPHEAPPRSLEQELRARSADIERRLDDHVDRFGRIEERLAVVEARGRRMGEIESLLEALEHRVEVIEQVLEILDGADDKPGPPRWRCAVCGRPCCVPTKCPECGSREWIDFEADDEPDLERRVSEAPEPKSWAAQEEKEASA